MLFDTPARVIARLLPHIPRHVKAALLVKFDKLARRNIFDWGDALRLAAFVEGGGGGGKRGGRERPFTPHFLSQKS